MFLKQFLLGSIPVLLTAGLAQGAIVIDASTSTNQTSASATVATPAFSTTSGNELLLAFVATDYLSGANTTVKSISGVGLTWVLAIRANAQSGTSEIWRAFATAPLSNATVTATLSQSVMSSITVMSFAGVNTSGANGSGAIGATASKSAASGAPTATLTTTANNSWVFGVGNDYDKAVARTPGTAQSLVHQYLSSAGDTYWVQEQNAPTPASGTSVTVNDTAPTGDRYNLSIVEVLANAAPTPPDVTVSKSHSGNFTQGQVGALYTLTVTNVGGTATTGTVTLTDSLPAGLTPTAISGTNWSCTLTTLTCTRNDALAVGASYPAITVTVNVASNAAASVTNTATVAGGGESNTTNDTASDVTTIVPFIPTWSISGSISPAASGSGATITASGGTTFTTTADVNGNYTFPQAPNGAYSVTPAKSGYTFTPGSQPVTINGANQSGVNFTAAAQTGESVGIDVNTSTDAAKAAATVASPAFSTSASNELLLALVATDYLTGSNTTVTGVSGGGLTWTLVLRTNTQSGSAEIWRAFAAVHLSNVTVTATLSQSVISSITVMSFTGVNTAGTNGSGAIGATAGKSAATGAPSATLTSTGSNSLVLGVGNDFDNATARTLGAGQSLIHQYLTPTGDTYWVQMLTSPVAASGTSVTINDTAPTKDRYNLSIVEVLAGSGAPTDTTPPTVSMTSPAPGTVASLLTVSANASDDTYVAGVQFLLDGSPLGGQLVSAPYTMTWNTATVANGSHTLTARATDSVGLTTTSTAVTITVDNSGNPATVGSWSSPIALPAVAVNLMLLQNNKVLLYQDGNTPTVWDYVQNTFVNIPAPADLFCSGAALLSDGRILVVGGYGESDTTIGIANAEIFDPSNNTWTPVPKMAYRRWYPTATTLPNGQILVTAGWQTTSHSNAGISEIYDPVANSWTQLTNANNPFETYPFMYVLPDGRIIHIGGSEYATDTDVLDLTTTTWSVIDPNIVDGASATMYTPGKFMKAGTATDSQGVGPALNTTYVLDMTQASPAWVETPNMSYPRSFLNLTTLPDGTVLATGGETDKNGGDIANAVYAAELWSPATKTWTTLASMHTPREYHGTAMLLPDGRVLESGMGADFGNVPNEMSAEFYSPPYLFKGAQPTISQAPSQVQYGTNFFVGTPNAASIASVVLIRTGAVTHFFDENERYVPLTFTQASGGLTVTAPANANLAPPGYYMLFIVNSLGVPSVAPFVQIP